jgi:hypothetical protein
VIDQEAVSILVGTDREAADVLQDWDNDLPQGLLSIELNVRQREILQRRRLFLRNRRIVSGYELLDRQLRSKLQGEKPGAPMPPTWLTVAKWSANAIGLLLTGEIPVPRRRRAVRRLVRSLLGALGSRRTIPMGRVFLLGNREIFAQVASALAIFCTIHFDELGLNYSAFVGKYGDQLLGLHGANIADELIFPISATTRDPLSDSMLRALHSYYRAIDSTSDVERAKWVLTGSLHLAAYEQRVAQIFLDVGLGADPGRRLRKLLGGLPPLNSPDRELHNRPLDMLGEDDFLRRATDLATAAFSTCYVLTLPVGSGPEQQRVFAPADSLELVTSKLVDFAKEVTKEKPSEAAQALQRIWFALDRADGRSDRCRVQDWRDYSARMSYVANLFVVAANPPERDRFTTPVFTDEDMTEFLSGRLIRDPGIVLNDRQRKVAEQLIHTAGPPPRTRRRQPAVAASASDVQAV